MQANGALLKLIDAEGVVPLLFMVSGCAAMERGSELIEPRDLIKAIYIADLEHVSKFWDDWESFETLITGASGAYINRTLYVVQIAKMWRETEEGFVGLGKASRAFQDIVAAARNLASERVNSPSTPASQDLLFCACSQDAELSAALQKSGLRLDKLEAAVRKPAV